MSLAALIARYGYLAIVVGTILEGETVLVLGGFAAYAGHLDLGGVVLAAFVGSLIGDQLYFYLGRRRAGKFLERRPRWRARTARALQLVERHQTKVILGFRFLYGLRTVTPFVLGMSGVPPLRFAALNALGAALWATIIGFVGYGLGSGADRVLGGVRRYELILGAAILATGALAWVVRWLRARRTEAPRPPGASGNESRSGPRASPPTDREA